MKKHRKSQTMGFLPINEDRSIFEKRIEMLNSLDPIARQIVEDYELLFKPSLEVGNSYIFLLKEYMRLFQVEMDKKTWIKSDIQACLDNIMVILKALGGRYCKSYYLLYRHLNFQFPISGKTDQPFIMTESVEYRVANIEYNQRNATSVLGVPSTTPVATSKVYVQDMGSGQGYYTTDSISGATKFTSTIMSDISALDYFSFYRPLKKKFTVNQMVRVPFGPMLPFPKTNIFTFTGYSVKEYFQFIKDAITMIEWLESENNAVEIRGNVDGVKLDAYEKVLKDQLTNINNISDLAQAGLTNEKIAFQTKKDEYAKIIADKKAELAKAIEAKKAEISKLNSKVVSYDSTLATKKAEVLKFLESQMGK